MSRTKGKRQERRLGQLAAVCGAGWLRLIRCSWLDQNGRWRIVRYLTKTGRASFVELGQRELPKVTPRTMLGTARNSEHKPHNSSQAPLTVCAIHTQYITP
ncbi:hypothetical protein I7I51_01480 [Histoplasma capsulatum]|uniref:Uncharacterized protein n=1 Tax=Ajellomyces capsulatus TaxID=5037 RepID=A0A8A1MIB9_AJECA|nr:hypothetical protein I7I51_01480 [Histoplasma capsulatum]